MEEAFALVQYALPLLHQTPQALPYNVVLENTIPVGRGLGFSAALCVLLLGCVCVWGG